MQDEMQALTNFQDALFKIPPTQIHAITRELEQDGKIYAEFAQEIYQRVPRRLALEDGRVFTAVEQSPYLYDGFLDIKTVAFIEGPAAIL